MAESCPTCGHPVVMNGIEKALTESQFRLFEIVKRAGVAGITRNEALDLLYADDASGGPNSANIISVMVNHMKPKLARHGLAIKGKRGPGGWIRLEKLEKRNDA